MHYHLFNSTTFSALILIGQNMLTDINRLTCYGTLLLVLEITVITVKTFEKTRVSLEMMEMMNPKRGKSKWQEFQ